MSKTNKSTFTLVLLSYNEKRNLEALLPQIKFSGFDHVFAVDGGSKDGTLDIYKKHDIQVYIQKEKGRGNAFLLALDQVKTSHIIFFSTDGNENPDDLIKMKNFLDEGYKMVVAGRYIYKESQTDDSDDPFRIRKLGGIIGGAFIKLIWKSSIKDAINGFRGFEVEAMHKLKLDAPSHEIELQSTIRAAKLKFSVLEFPTKELKRKYEVRKASASTFKLIYNLGKFLLREIKIGHKF